MFWKAAQDDEAAEAQADDPTTQQDNVVSKPDSHPESQNALPLVAIGGLIGAARRAASVFAGPVNRTLAATAEQLFAPEPYIATVLNTDGKEIHHEPKTGESYLASQGGAPSDTGEGDHDSDADAGESHGESVETGEGH